jgi:hypothetical protein
MLVTPVQSDRICGLHGASRGKTFGALLKGSTERRSPLPIEVGRPSGAGASASGHGVLKDQLGTRLGAGGPSCLA